jgi:hypothetical protein
MSDKRSNEQLDGLRERLYARGENPKPHPRTSLRPERSFRVDDIAARPPKAAATVIPPPPVDLDLPEGKGGWRDWGRRNLRTILILVGASFFVLSVLISSLYIMLGRNTVSGANIDLGITGPFTVGGGESLALQVGITNQNSVAIESATIIVEYPPGTRSADGQDKELYSERLPVTAGIAPGETRNISVRARVFGEENQEESVRVSVEYRVVGSSATFYKEAAPHRFKIGSAPIALKVDAEETISSGQETTVRLTITSNSPSPISNLIVQAEYPSGFDFTESTPAPVSGRNVWSIPELQPETSATIEISGIVTGTESEQYVVRFTAGVSDERNQGSLASVLAVGDVEFTLENPFLSVEVEVDNRPDETVTIGPNSQAVVSLDVRNTLPTTIHDGLIEVKLSGNALSDSGVSVSNGYYDSNTNTVRFDVASVSSLRRIDPGETVNLSFNIQPETSGVESPQIRLDVSASARRVSQNSARETIAGTIGRTIRVESRPTVAAELLEATAGPVPPRVGQTTTYDLGWRVVNSANSISGAVVTAVLPSYVEWTGETSGSGAWSYNPSTRTIEWQVGSVNSGSEASGTFEVNFLPSSSLTGRTPTLVESASLRSQDNFTGSTLRHSAGAVTTELSDDRNSGVVQGN